MLIQPPTSIDTGHTTMPIYNCETDKEVDNPTNKPGMPSFQMKMDIRHSGDKDLQALISHTKAISESSITTKTKKTPSFMDMYVSKEHTTGTSEDSSEDSASDFTTSTPSDGNDTNDDKPPPSLDEKGLADQEKAAPSLADAKLVDSGAIKQEPLELLHDRRGDELAKEDMKHLIALETKIEEKPNPAEPNMIKLLERTRIEK